MSYHMKCEVLCGRLCGGLCRYYVPECNFLDVSSVFMHVCKCDLDDDEDQTWHLKS